MPNILERIALSTTARVRDLKAKTSVQDLRRRPFYRREPRDLKAVLAGPGPRVIAEIKFASPSGGESRWKPSGETAAQIAGSYLSAGAAAVSILTEPQFFRGSPAYLEAVRRAHPAATLLMKDFFIDPYQFELARASGADAVLLIAALVGDRLEELLLGARSLGLSVLVEVHDEREMTQARKAKASLIGVNSRNLKTLDTDLAVAKRLAAPGGSALLVAESGIKTNRDLTELSRLGYQAFLVGTHLMRHDEPGLALRELLALEG